MYRTDLRASLAASLDPEPAHRPAPGDRLASVLVPILDGPSVVFTKRTEHLPRHAGEISFPGGIRHEEDATAADTALRETEEELGIPRDEVHLLGALPPVHTFVSAILIVPFVGMFEGRPAFRPNEGEIAEVLEFGIEELVRSETQVEWRRERGVYRGYAYEMGVHTIWGATATILHSLLQAIPKEPA